jgi:RNA polymerase sigma-70 factor (ECF subfamily)
VRRGLNQAFDDYLVLLSQAGSRDAFARLAARWTPKLLAFAARTLGNTEAARDVVQDTWESALRGLRRIEDPARFPAWIYAIASRKCADALRAKYRSGRAAVAAHAQATLDSVEVDAEAAAGDHIDLAAALKRLPAEQRVAFSLFFGEDMSVADIAAATGVAPGTVKSRLFAARQTLRAHMQGEIK